jgi:hypothetical protein
VPSFHGGNTSSTLYGTPSVFKDLDRFNGTLTGIMRQIYGMDVAERHGMEASPKRRIIARSSTVFLYELYANLSADRPAGKASLRSAITKLA